MRIMIKKVLFIVVALLAISTVSYGELVAGDFEGVVMLDERDGDGLLDTTYDSGGKW